MVTSGLLFAFMGVALQLAARELPNTVVVFARNALGLLAFVPLLPRFFRIGWRTQSLREHLIRGLAGLFAMYGNFYAIAHLPLAEAVLINYSVPLFMPLIERAWLGEPVPKGLPARLAVGFAGVLLVLKPGSSLFQPAALAGLWGAAAGALAQVGIRRLTATEPTLRIVVYFSVIATLASAAPLPFAWRLPQTNGVWVALIAAGVLASVAQLFLTRSYAYAPAGSVGPFMFASVLWAAGLDYLVFDRTPAGATLAGGTLIVVAGVLSLRAAPRVTAPTTIDD
jgi:drug/metabolite transporter (DMT)-like permease